MLKIEPGSNLSLCAQFSQNNYMILTVMAMASMLVITMGEVAALTIDSKTTVLDSRSATAARSDGEFESSSLFKQNQT
jgi:hypothetical protein